MQLIVSVKMQIDVSVTGALCEHQTIRKRSKTDVALEMFVCEVVVLKFDKVRHGLVCDYLSNADVVFY